MPAAKDDLGRDLDDLLALSKGARAVFGVHTRRPRHAPKPAVVLISFLVVAGIAGAAVLMSQTVPPVPAFGMTPNCATLTPSNQSLRVGSSGHLVLDCAGSSRAFRTYGVFPATPSFNLPANYSSLHIFPFGNADGSLCVNIVGSRTLTSGVSQTFTEQADWAYCAEYRNVTAQGLAAFTVTWST